jgi:quinohemoprotein ethanol dehydrogenase
VPQEIDIVPEGARVDANGQLPNKGRIFTPFWTDVIMVKPGTNGGPNWPPSSFDPETNLLYVCATDRISTFWVREQLETPGPNKVYMGGGFGQADVDDAGVLAALDVRTNRLAWRQQWREICYSGSVVTAGGLLFVGRADGRLTALDKGNGAKLWEFMTDAGVNTTVTTFEHKGKQYVVVHAGGGLFAGGKRGDGIWMFSLDGKMESLAPKGGPGSSPGGGPGGGPGRGASPPPPGAGAAGTARPVDRANGERLYKSACLPCHGAAGEGGHGGGPSIIAGQTSDTIISISTTGKNNMPSFAATLSTDDIRDIASYVVDALQKTHK